MKPADRNIPLKEAKERAYAIIESLGLSYNTSERELGPYRRADCTITKGRSKYFIASGSGKGEGETANTGAVCEALESLSMKKDFFLPDTIILPSHNLHNESKTQDERLVDTILKHDNHPMSFRRYKSINSDSSLLYPTFYSTPFYQNYAKDKGDTYDYQNMMRYSSSTGVSIGSCLEEIVIHSVNENLERDAFGLFLLRIFFTNDALIKVVNHSSLPKTLYSKLKDLEICIKSRIVIFDLTVCDIGIPVFCAINQDDWSKGRFPTIKGFGCSPNKDYAIERSISELAQFVAVCIDKPQVASDFYNSLMREKPSYLNKCVTLDLSGIIEKRAKNVDFDDIPFYQYGNNINEQYEFITQFLINKNREVFYSENANFNNQLFVGHVFIPGMEKFYMNSFGGPTLPRKNWLERVYSTKLVV